MQRDGAWEEMGTGGGPPAGRGGAPTTRTPPLQAGPGGPAAGAAPSMAGGDMRDPQARAGLEAMLRAAGAPPDFMQFLMAQVNSHHEAQAQGGPPAAEGAFSHLTQKQAREAFPIFFLL